MIMEITNQEYINAKQIVKEYEKQLELDEENRCNYLKDKQLDREIECLEKYGQHEYRPEVYKWGSTTIMKCVCCGKVID